MPTIPIPLELDSDELYQRAGECFDYNSFRRFSVRLRLTDVTDLLEEIGNRRGYQTLIAKELEVSRATICRDIARLKRGELLGDDWKQMLATIMLPSQQRHEAKTQAIAKRRACQASAQRPSVIPAIAHSEPNCQKPKPHGNRIQAPTWLPWSDQSTSRLRETVLGAHGSPRRAVQWCRTVRRTTRCA